MNTYYLKNKKEHVTEGILTILLVTAGIETRFPKMPNIMQTKRILFTVDRGYWEGKVK